VGHGVSGALLFSPIFSEKQRMGVLWVIAGVVPFGNVISGIAHAPLHPSPAMTTRT
jgi:hypothetical protein